MGSAGVAAQDARADERMRIDVRVPQELAALRLDLRADRRARSAASGVRVGIDLVAEHPQMSRGQPALFAALQAQLGGRWPVIGARSAVGGELKADSMGGSAAGSIPDIRAHRGILRPAWTNPTPEPGRQPEIHQPADRRDQSLSAPACAQPGRLVSLGRGGLRAALAQRQADPPHRRLRRLPLVPRARRRELRGRGHRTAC